MELIKVKYTGEGTHIRPVRMGGKVEVKKGDILDVEKDNVDFFLKRECIEVKIADKKTTTKKKI